MVNNTISKEGHLCPMTDRSGGKTDFLKSQENHKEHSDDRCIIEVEISRPYR